MTGPIPRFGGQSSTAPLRDVLVKRPGPAFGAAFDRPELGFRHPVDLARAQREHDAFTDLLAQLGARVHQLPEEADLAELVYTYDPLLITDRGAIALLPGKEARRAEPPLLVNWATQAGIPAGGHIEAPGSVEGGDAFWLRRDLLCIGRTLRTNDAGARQLASLVDGEARIFDLPYWRGPDELVHLMSVISPLADDLVLVHPPLLPVGLWELLDRLEIRIVEVAEEEYATLGCNALAVRPGVLVMADGNPRTRRSLEHAGCDVHTYSALEIGLNGGGGPTCMTRAIWREV